MPLSITRTAVLLLLSASLLAPASAGTDQPPGNDLLLPADQHSSEKARQLATAHHAALRELSEAIHHCLPWLKMDGKWPIGFFKPKGATGDERYLSLRVYVEQGISPQFTQLSQQERAAAMFSRYVGALLRRMAADEAVLGDPNLDGFTVILEWQKPGTRSADNRLIHETIAVFVKRPAVAGYLAGRLPIAQLSGGAHVLGWEGETSLGPLQLKAWEDDFVATRNGPHHENTKDVTCPR